MVPLLQLTDIAKSFGAVQALRGVSFDLRGGEVHALLGENGAGKSTLIKVVTGAHRPDSGTIEIIGQARANLTTQEARRLGIACVYQQPALFPDLTVAENIALRLEPTGAIRRVRWTRRRTQADEWLKRLGADISARALVRNLSMPEQQLVEMACAIGANARIVIMDEPTASLTQQEQQRLFEVVRRLRQDGVGIIYISHRMEEVFALADRVTVLRDGESVATLRLDEVTEASLVRLMVGREVDWIFPPREARVGEVVLSARGLSCHDGAIRDVDFDLRAGEILGLAGLVGAGRTELARVLFGITPADQGEIRLYGQSIRIASPTEAVAHGIGYVTEDRRRHGVHLEMSVANNITLASHTRLFPRGWLRREVEQVVAAEFIETLDIKTDGADGLAGALSGGNQQKVALARWLATRPKVLILDEPTQGVDVGAKSEIHRIIRNLAKSGLGILMISSDLPEILGMSDRIGVMRSGTIVATLPGGVDSAEVMSAALGTMSEGQAA
ncbi:MAG TPA: sugar ABC transporter ATP-binding protein [Candidatus Limnocylindria bacterium]|nr:sugar ABC transporter ATP-binding protein [Candidatus Limnocylindria bacterium]